VSAGVRGPPGRSVEDNDPARDGSIQHQTKPLVDLIEPVGPADLTVEVNLLLDVKIGEDRKIDVGPNRAVMGAAALRDAEPGRRRNR
jgi:hypothetical protein